jgi:hypothetical protein
LSGTLKFPVEAGTKIPSIKRLLVLHKQAALGMENNNHPQASIEGERPATEAEEQFRKIVVKVVE